MYDVENEIVLARTWVFLLDISEIEIPLEGTSAIRISQILYLKYV